MPELNLKQSIMTSLTAQEPWPDNVKLFQPYEVEQILLPDNASCLAVQAFLKMCNLSFEVEMRWNAEFMSPSGRVPFIKCGAFVVSELEPIAQFAANKGVSLCSRLSSEEQAEMRAYMSLITNVLVNAELYISWLDNDTFNTVTKVRNSSVYPWPLGWLQTRAKRNAVAKRLKALHWHYKTLEQVLADVEQCCSSLSQRLGDRDYFFGTPTPLDALLYGHIRALLSAAGPRARLIIKPITSVLLQHTLRVAKLTEMELTPQEEYLVKQACQVSYRRLSPERTMSDRSARIRRSKMSIRNLSKDSIACNGRDVFGFKPFASKQIIIMKLKEGGIACEYDESRRFDQTSIPDDQKYYFINDLIDEIIDKVIEIAVEDFNEIDIGNERIDFEVIDLPLGDGGSKIDNIETEINDFLDTIEENDLTDTTTSLETTEDLIQVINDDDQMMDSDGFMNDKHLSSIHVGGMTDDVLQDTSDSYNASDSSNNGLKNTEENSTISSTAERESLKNICTRSETPTLSDSKSTLKMLSSEEISVESLLQYLRKRNAAYNNYPEVVDVD